MLIVADEDSQAEPMNEEDSKPEKVEKTADMGCKIEVHLNSVVGLTNLKTIKLLGIIEG